MSVLSSRASWISWPLKMVLLGCYETSLHIYHSTLRNIIAEQRSHLQGSGSLKSYITSLFQQHHPPPPPQLFSFPEIWASCVYIYVRVLPVSATNKGSKCAGVSQNHTCSSYGIWSKFLFETFPVCNIGSHRVTTEYVQVNVKNDSGISRDRDRKKTCPSVDSLRHCFWDVHPLQ
jgi:hypothetical protein